MASSFYRSFLLIRRSPFLSHHPLLLYLLLLFFLLVVSNHDDTLSVEAIHQGHHDVQKQQQQPSVAAPRVGASDEYSKNSTRPSLVPQSKVEYQRERAEDPQQQQQQDQQLQLTIRIQQQTKTAATTKRQPTTTSAPPPSSVLLFPCLLAASAGWGDVRAQRTYGCFVNMCTGNTIRGTLAMAEGRWNDALRPYAVVTGYVAGVVWARAVNLGLQRKKQQQQQQHVTITTGKPTSSWRMILARFVRQLPSFLASLIKSHSWFENANMNSNTCLEIVPSIAILFVLADVFTWWSHNSSSSKPAASMAALLAQAVAYGLLHETASQATGGTVLFAVTGHWASMARSATDYCCDAHNDGSSSVAHTMKLKRHAGMVGSFIAGIVLSVLFLDHVVPLLPAASSSASSSSSWQLYYPVYSFTGVFYVLLFLWYGTAAHGATAS